MTKEELRAAWLEALRSGKYKQGKNFLCNRNLEYCCLGVLCEVAGIPKVKEDDLFSFDYSSASLPAFLKEKVGLYSSLGNSKDVTPSLSALNDNGNSFSEIADLLETGDYWVE